MKRMLLGALGSVLLALPVLSFAGPITWNYTGTCDWGGCSGQSISGTIIGDPTDYGSNNALDGYLFFGDIDFYSFTLGSYTFSGGSAGAQGSYLLDTLGNIVGGSMKFVAVGENVLEFDLLGVGTANWRIDECFIIWCGGAAGGKGSYTASVPEPGTLALFGLGVLATGLAVRRRRVSVK